MAISWNRFQDPAQLFRRVDLINQENRVMPGTDVKGESVVKIWAMAHPDGPVRGRADWDFSGI